MRLSEIALAASLLVLTGCASPAATTGGPPVALSPALAADARVRNIEVATAVLYNMPLPGFSEQLRAALNDCATGDRPLDLRAQVEQPDRERLRVTVELVDPGADRSPVGRYEIQLAEAAPLVRHVDGPPQSDVGSRVGRRLCAEAFEPQAAAILQGLDMMSFPNSLRPSRAPGRQRPPDWGFVQPSTYGDEHYLTRMDEGREDWVIGLRIIRREPEGVIGCFSDKALNGGSYRARQAIRIVVDDAGGYRVAENDLNEPTCKPEPGQG